MLRFRRAGAVLILLSLVSAWSAVEGAGASQVLPDARGAFGVLSAGAKVTNPQALQAELTLESGVKLWFSIGAIPSQRVAPSNGSSLAHYLSTYYLLAPNASVKFVGTFPEPGDRVTLTATLNSAEAALLNIEQVLVTAALAMVPGSKSVKPKVLVETLQDFKRVRGVYQASQAFLPPPKTAAGWVTASVRAADSLRGVLADTTQRALLLKALQKVGVDIAADDLKQLLTADNVRGLLKLIADEAIFIYATRGKEPVVVYERSQAAARSTVHTIVDELEAALNDGNVPRATALFSDSATFATRTRMFGGVGAKHEIRGWLEWLSKEQFIMTPVGSRTVFHGRDVRWNARVFVKAWRDFGIRVPLLFKVSVNIVDGKITYMNIHSADDAYQKLRSHCPDPGRSLFHVCGLI